MLPQAAHGSESSLDSSLTTKRAPGSVCVRGLREEIGGFGLGLMDGISKRQGRHLGKRWKRVT